MKHRRGWTRVDLPGGTLLIPPARGSRPVRAVLAWLTLGAAVATVLTAWAAVLAP